MAKKNNKNNLRKEMPSAETPKSKRSSKATVKKKCCNTHKSIKRLVINNNTETGRLPPMKWDNNCAAFLPEKSLSSKYDSHCSIIKSETVLETTETLNYHFTNKESIPSSTEIIPSPMSSALSRQSLGSINFSDEKISSSDFLQQGLLTDSSAIQTLTSSAYQLQPNQLLADAASSNPDAISTFDVDPELSLLQPEFNYEPIDQFLSPANTSDLQVKFQPKQGTNSVYACGKIRTNANARERDRTHRCVSLSIL